MRVLSVLVRRKKVILFFIKKCILFKQFYFYKNNEFVLFFYYREMLDHMVFAHEFDNGSVNTDVNTSDINYRIGQRDESNSNSIIDYEDARENGESGSNDTSVNMEMFDNGNGDNTTTITNNEMVFGTNDENIIAETVECTLGLGDNDDDTTNTSKSFEKINFNSSSSSDDPINDMMVSCEYSEGEEDDEITVKTTEASKSSIVNVKSKVSVIFDISTASQ